MQQKNFFYCLALPTAITICFAINPFTKGVYVFTA